MVSNDDVARAFANGSSLTAGNMYTDGNVVYSYGAHWPIAARTDKGIVLNTDKYGVTTSCHTSCVRSAVNDYIEVSLAEIKSIIESDGKEILIRRVKPEDEEAFSKAAVYYCVHMGLNGRTAKSLVTKWNKELRHSLVLGGV